MQKRLLGLLSVLVIGSYQVQAGGGGGAWVYKPGETLMRACGIKSKGWGTATQSKANAKRMARSAQRAKVAEALREKERTEHRRYYANHRREFERQRELSMREREADYSEVREMERKLAAQKSAKKFRAYPRVLDTTILQRVAIAAHVKRQKKEARREQQEQALKESRKVRRFDQDGNRRGLAASMSAARARRAETEYLGAEKLSLLSCDECIFAWH